MHACIINISRVYCGKTLNAVRSNPAVPCTTVVLLPAEPVQMRQEGPTDMDHVTLSFTDAAPGHFPSRIRTSFSLPSIRHMLDDMIVASTSHQLHISTIGDLFKVRHSGAGKDSLQTSESMPSEAIQSDLQKVYECNHSIGYGEHQDYFIIDRRL